MKNQENLAFFILKELATQSAAERTFRAPVATPEPLMGFSSREGDEILSVTNPHPD